MSDLRISQLNEQLSINNTDKLALDQSEETVYAEVSDLLAKFNAEYKPHRTLFDHYIDRNNTGTDETDFYSDTISAGQLSADGDAVSFVYAGNFAANGNNKQVRVYFGGTVIMDSTALAANGSAWKVTGTIIRDSSTSVRTESYIIVSGVGTIQYYGNLTGLTLSNAQILKITGQSDTAGDDVTVGMGKISFEPAG